MRGGFQEHVLSWVGEEAVVNKFKRGALVLVSGTEFRRNEGENRKIIAPNLQKPIPSLK